MFKTKIVEKIVRFELFLTVIGQLCKSDQFPIPKQDFSKKHQPFDFYEIAELRKTLVAKLRKT